MIEMLHVTRAIEYGLLALMRLQLHLLYQLGEAEDGAAGVDDVLGKGRGQRRLLLQRGGEQLVEGAEPG